MDPDHSRAVPVRIGVVGVGRKAAAPGLAWADSVQELAAASDVFVTVLPGPVELRQAVVPYRTPRAESTPLPQIRYRTIFGVPRVSPASSGTPVAVARTPALAEVAGSF